VFPVLRAAELDAGPQVGSHQSRAEQRGRITSLDLLATLLLMQLGIWLVFWVASTRCWVMLSFLSTNIPKSFSARLLSIPSSPSLY